MLSIFVPHLGFSKRKSNDTRNAASTGANHFVRKFPRGGNLLRPGVRRAAMCFPPRVSFRHFGRRASLGRCVSEPADRPRLQCLLKGDAAGEERALCVAVSALLANRKS